MKLAKKLIALLTVAAMVLALGTAAMAGTEPSEPTAGYTITIENGAEGEDYTAYKVFDVTLTSPGNDDTGFAYTISNTSWAWDVLINGVTPNESGVYISTDYGLTFTPTAADPTVYSVVPIEGAGAMDETKAAALTQKLHAVEDKGEPAGTLTDYDSENNKKITVSELGYYFVETSLGALCSLDTTNTDATIYEKNSIPTIGKQVMAHDGSDYAKTADVHGGDEVFYLLTINTGTNSHSNGNTSVDGDYVIVDTLPEGVIITDEQLRQLTVSANNKDWTIRTDYTVTYDAASRKLTITLLGEATTGKLHDIAQDTVISIKYKATLTKDAAADTGLVNTAVLTYKNQRSEDSSTVYTWSFNTLKFTGTEDSPEPLAGATFQLLDKDKTVLKLIDLGNNKYRYDARIQEAAAGSSQIDGADISIVTEITTDDTGVFYIEGLDSGEYYLHETAAPDGYNPLAEDTKVTITAKAPETTGDETAAATTLEKTVSPVISYKNDKYVAIQNNTGTILPATGGIGTTIFITVGALAVLFAGVFLVTNRRMKNEEF